MNFYKIKFLKAGQPAGRSYTYKSRLNLGPGDKVELPGGKHAIVADEPVDMGWVETYGEENLKEILKKCEPEEYRIVDIRDADTRQTRADGRYPLRIGRIVKKPKLHLGIPMIIEYLRNADGSDYSGMTLRTSHVCGSFINEKGNLVVETMNSAYEFEPIAAERED